MNFTINEVFVGQQVKITERITREKIDEFAHCSGDYSPIHMNEEYANNTSFKGCIAHGILSAAYISKLLGMYLPGEGTIYLEQSLQFKRAVYPGDTIEVIGEIIEINKEKEYCVVKTECINQNHKLVVTGIAKVIPPRGEK